MDVGLAVCFVESRVLNVNGSNILNNAKELYISVTYIITICRPNCLTVFLT